jgi:hypothetical protein
MVGAALFKGLVEQKKKKLYSTRSCVNWAFLALVGPLMPKKLNRQLLIFNGQSAP